MRTLSVVFALLLVACATTPTPPAPDSLIARGPTSLVLVRDGARWAILKDHSS